MKTKIIVLLSVLIFALGIFCACGGNKDSAGTSDSVSVVEPDSGSDSVEESDSTKESESAHTHNFVFEAWVTAPGLETKGKAKLKCECNEEKEEEVPALTDVTVWTLTADVADPCVGGEAEYSSDKYGKVKVEVAVKHELGELVPAKAATCKEDGNVAYRQCAKCKKYFGEDGEELTTIVVNKVAHTPADAIRENEVAATCTVAGSYDEVVKCSVCGEEISRETKTVDALGHTPKAAVQENVVNATCTVPGSYDSVVYCSVCNAEISREHVTGKTVPHTAGAATRENEKPATCKAEGSYEEVIKCSVCGTEMSRTTKSIAKLAHTPADPVRENVVAATCTAAGSYDEVVKCSVCGEEISRVTKSVDALGHTPAAAVQENVVAATCYAAGSYNEVVKCSVCNEEISKESKTIAIVDHNFVNGKCDMCGLAVNYAGVRFYSGNDYTNNYSSLFTFNAKGVAADGGIYIGSSYADSKVTFKWVDFAAGKLTLTINYNYISSSGGWGDDYGWGEPEETKTPKTEVFHGYFDKANGAIVVGAANKEEITNGFIVFLPSETVIESAASSSQLGGQSAMKAGTVVLSDGSGYSVFVMNGKVYFDVTFTNVNGEAVEAGALNPKTYADGFTFVVKQGNDVVAAYGVKDGVLDALDSVFGSYTSGEDTLVLDGLGTATLGDKVGTYVVNGAVVEIKIAADGKVTEYYEATLDGSSYTIDKPMVTVSFDLGADHGTKDAITVNKNTDFDLATIKLANTETEMFKGWALNGEPLTGATYVFTSDVVLTAEWTAKVTITVTDSVKGNETLYAGAGDSILEVLKAHDVSHETKVFSHYEMEGALLEEGSDVIPEGVTEVEVVAVYFENVTVNVHPGMNIADVVASITYGSNVKDYLAENFAYTSCVDGYKFDGWFLNSELTVELAADKLADGEMEVYGKWSWAGNVKYTEQKKYPFVYVAEKNAWKSTNENQGNTSSVFEIVVTSGVANIEFDYWITSENGFDYATIYYYEDGARKELKTKGSDIAEANAQHLSTTLTYTGETEIALRISYSKDSSGNKGLDAIYIANLKINGIAIFAQAPLNPDAVGTYTTADGTVVTLTAGGGATVGDETVAYTTISENVIGVNLAVGYREITLNKADNTCVIAVPQVSVTYNYNGHGDNTTVNVDKYSTQTVISDVPAAEGFIFRGWYKEATFVTKANGGSTFTADSDITFYAKWDKAITVTYKYEDNGAHADEVVNMFANDKLTLKVVDFDFDGKVFVGWYTKTEAGEYDAKMADNTVMTEDAVLYAKWVEAPKSYGSYKGWNLYTDGTSGTKDASSFTNEYFSVAADGTYKLGSSATGTLTAEQAAITDGSMVLSGYYVYFNKELGIAWRGYRANATGVGDDTYVAVDTGRVASIDFSGFKGNGTSYVAYMTITYKDNTVKNAFFYDSKIVANATWGDGVSAKDAYNADRLVSLNGAPIAKVVGKSIIGNDGLGGTFTCDAGVYVLNGFGDVTFTATGAEAVTGTYKSLGNDVFGITLADRYKEITVNRADGTCVVVVPQVTVAYNYNGHGENTSVQVDKNSQQTVLEGEPLAEGFKFRGWYRDEEFKNKVTAGSKFTASEDITFHAKWDEAITVTFKFEDENVHEDVVVNMYAHDKITLQKVDFSYNGMTFVGWYTMSDAGDLDQKISEGDEITATVVLYAKWVEAPQSYGTYKGWNMDDAFESGTKASFTSEYLSVAVDGSFKLGSTTGTLTDEQAAITDGVLLLDNKYVYFNKELGLIWTAYSSNPNGVNNDTNVGVDVSRVKSIKYSGCKGAVSYIAMFEITYQDNTVKTAFLFNSKIVANVTWNEGVDVTAICKQDFTVKVNGVTIAKVVAKAVLENDGLGGTYTGDYGEIVVDGYGSVTVGGATVDYTVIAERTIKFVSANAMREVVVDLGNGTYAKVQDGYEGTYTLPDNSTLTLDGYGGAGEGKTYVVSGTNITIYEGETSATYGLDVENKQLLGKSVFAGYTFKGSYLDKWDDSTAFSVVFEDSPEIKGYLSTNNDGLRVMFTAVLDGTTLTLTMPSENSISWDKCKTYKSDSAFNGKVVVMKVEGDTLKVTSTTISNGAYTFKSGTAKCEGFSL